MRGVDELTGRRTGGRPTFIIIASAPRLVAPLLILPARLIRCPVKIYCRSSRLSRHNAAAELYLDGEDGESSGF